MLEWVPLIILAIASSISIDCTGGFRPDPCDTWDTGGSEWGCEDPWMGDTGDTDPWDTDFEGDTDTGVVGDTDVLGDTDVPVDTDPLWDTDVSPDTDPLWDTDVSLDTDPLFDTDPRLDTDPGP